MSPFALPLLLALAAAPETVAVLPLEPLGIDPARAQEVERGLQETIAAKGIALVAPETVRSVLLAEPALAHCDDALCFARAAAKLGATSVVSGLVGGLGSFESIMLRRTGVDGAPVASTEQGAEPAALFALLFPEAPAATAQAPVETVTAPAETVTAPTTNWRGPTRWVASGLALASVGAGVGFGLSSRNLSEGIASGTTGCDGAGEAYAGCVADRFETGRSRALLSNVFLGTGAALAVGAAVRWLGPESETGVGPGPTAAGLSVHGRF